MAEDSDVSPPDSDGSCKPPPKKAKSRYRVWQKVTRLTKRSCGSKDDSFEYEDIDPLSPIKFDLSGVAGANSVRMGESSSFSDGEVGDLPESSFRKRSHFYPNCEKDEQNCLKPSLARAVLLQLNASSPYSKVRPKHAIYPRKKPHVSVFNIPKGTKYTRHIHGVTEDDSSTDHMSDCGVKDDYDGAVILPNVAMKWGSAMSLDTALAKHDVYCVTGDVYKPRCIKSEKPKQPKLKRAKCQPKSHSLPARYRAAGRHRISRSHLAGSSRLMQGKITTPNICHCQQEQNHCQNENNNVDNNPGQVQPGVSPTEFKQKKQLMQEWFCQFSDEQKNLLLKDLLELCDLPQHHLLSLEIGDRPHEGCPPNCQDILTWLPRTIALYILSMLDPVSLCRASAVCTSWNELATEPCLWRELCVLPKWRLSQLGEEKQLIQHLQADGSVRWKQVFAERYHLRTNWLKGRCHVRTFEGHTQGVSCVQFDETRIVSGSSDKTIKVWNIRTNTPWLVQTLVGHSGTVRCLHLDGNRLVSGSTDRTIKVWDLSTHHDWTSIACKVTMVGHTDTVRCLQVKGDKVISGSYDKTLKLWDIKSGQCKKTLRGHDAAVLCVQFDDTKIISGSADKSIKVWMFAGQCVMTLHGHHGAVTCLQFDDTRIISGSLDCNLKFWDLHKGTCINTIDWKASEGHTGVVRCLQADRWKVVSASDDRTLKVWSLNTGQRLATLRNHTDGVTCLQFNDNIIVSGSYDKTVKLWDFSSC